MDRHKYLIFAAMACALSGCGLAGNTPHTHADESLKRAATPEDDDITSAIKEDERKNDQITATRINDPGRKAALPALHLGTTTVSRQIPDVPIRTSALSPPDDRKIINQNPIATIFPRSPSQPTPVAATANLSQYLNKLSSIPSPAENIPATAVPPTKNTFNTQPEDAITFPKDQPPKDVLPAQVGKTGQPNTNTALKIAIKKKAASPDGQTQHIDPATASLPDGMTQQDLQQVF